MSLKLNHGCLGVKQVSKLSLQLRVEPVKGGVRTTRLLQKYDICLQAKLMLIEVHILVGRIHM